MESGLSSSWEYKTLISELTQGMEKAKQLHFHMCSTSPSEAQDLLLQRILSSYEKALLILKRKGSSAVGQAQAQVVALTSGGPEPSISVDGSPGSEDLNKNLIRDHQECSPSKKRKLQPIWTEQVRVNSENGLDGPSDGGYSWRKYGQKDILGAKYPSLDGNNTNNEMPAQFTFPSTYPENHDFHVGSSSSYCPSFVSPATSDTNNYFSPVNNYQSFGANRSNYQHLESDIAEIISAHASTNNSPIGGMEFPSDPLDLDPNFLFNASGFFT
ncbi:probable WRKY transcription factor 41 [Phtheirospermum japonicum]|uniref:Probable WRKY transcription factor 41 n=1 Tax=Phtheirospermum japonicum TaxID=374723 RepID=A0A830BKE1_9LAMI|nr:probable WRKY transcription factor 41 [Phtheirospermum japonicum]